MPGVPADRTGSAGRRGARRAFDGGRRRAGRARRCTFDVPIGPLTTYRVGGAAALFVRIGSLDDLGVSGERGPRRPGCRWSCSGRGSNMLVADAGFAGIVVSATARHRRVRDRRRAARVVRAGASVRAARPGPPDARPADSPASSGRSAFRVRSAGRCG